MVYGQLMGGLGNQMFIYSFCKRLVKETGQKAVLYFDSEDGRPLELSHFSLDEHIQIVQKPFLNDYKGNLFLYKGFRKIIEHLPNGNIQKLFIQIATHFGIVFVPEGYCPLNYSELKKHDNIIVNGFFQSEKYLETIGDSVKKEFGILNSMSDEKIANIEKIVNRMSKENTVCIHIRRGDYLSELYQERFLVCDDSYYRTAIELIEQNIQNAKYYVFSDSIEWVKQNMKFIDEVDHVYVDNGGELAVIYDFYMMKACKHFIMSNSTLSWWVQYLGDYSQKIVVAPSRWLNYGYDNKDIYQANWKIIDV